MERREQSDFAQAGGEERNFKTWERTVSPEKGGDRAVGRGRQSLSSGVRIGAASGESADGQNGDFRRYERDGKKKHGKQGRLGLQSGEIIRCFKGGTLPALSDYFFLGPKAEVPT